MNKKDDVDTMFKLVLDDPIISEGEDYHHDIEVNLLRCGAISIWGMGMSEEHIFIYPEQIERIAELIANRKSILKGAIAKETRKEKQ